jgi:hypothetical protein
MRPKRVIWWCAGLLAILIIAAVGYCGLIVDWSGRPFCHKQIMFGFLNEIRGDLSNDSKPFPNVKGISRDSLASIGDSMGGYKDWTNDYNYVPGLREDDPPDLVLMYFNRPTRWNWHGAPPTIFKNKAWIVIPVDFDLAAGFRPHTNELGECSERISTDEFRNRLKRTLDFVRTNERPNWQAVIAEHNKFLDAIEHDK